MIPVQLLHDTGLVPVQILMRPIQVPKDEMPEGTSQKCEESAIISAMEKAKASIKAGVVHLFDIVSSLVLEKDGQCKSWSLSQLVKQPL